MLGLVSFGYIHRRGGARFGSCFLRAPTDHWAVAGCWPWRINWLSTLPRSPAPSSLPLKEPSPREPKGGRSGTEGGARSNSSNVLPEGGGGEDGGPEAGGWDGAAGRFGSGNGFSKSSNGERPSDRPSGTDGAPCIKLSRTLPPDGPSRDAAAPLPNTTLGSQVAIWGKVQSRPIAMIWRLTNGIMPR